MKFTWRSSTPSSSQDAHLLVRETLRISANLASSPAPQTSVDVIKRVEDYASLMRLICYEEVDGRRSYLVPEGFLDSVSPSYVPYMTWRALKVIFDEEKPGSS
ncbi:root UVB sensitive 6-like protein [Tanacetum coccineum]